MRWIAVASSALTGLVVAGAMALAAAPGVINAYNAVCNPDFPKQCLQVDSNGAIPVTGASGGSGGGAALKATAVPPTYVEGSTTNPLSSDLSGFMRTLAAAKATASPPVYSEGIDNPLSQDLAGNLRITGTLASTLKATAADPSYIEGALNPFSADLSGYLRSKIKAPAGAYAAGSLAVGAGADGWDATQGAKTDARSTATDTTPASAISILKELSFMAQAPAQVPVTQVGSPWGVTLSGNLPVTQVTSPWITAGVATIADDGILTGALKTWAILAGFDGTGADMIRAGPVSNAVGAVGYLDVLPTARYDATAPTLTTGNYNALQTGSRGALQVQLQVNDSSSGLASATGMIDATANSPARLVSQDFPMVFNGVSWDRLREITDGLNSIGAGIPAAGLVGQCDDTSPVTVGENQFGNARINCTDHSLLVTTVNSATVPPIAPIVSTALETGHVLKASAGTLYGVEVTTTSAAGYLLVFNAASIPSAGAVAPVATCTVATNATCSMDFNPPLALSAGITVTFSASVTPFIQANSATAYFSGQIQ